MESSCNCWLVVFFFQAEDGIRDGRVTGVQTCALPIYRSTAMGLPRGEDPLLYSDPLERLLRAAKTFPVPVIAMVHGSVWEIGRRRVGKEGRSRGWPDH